MKRFGTLIFITIMLSLSVFMTGCMSTEIEFDRENSVKVVFVLEGGTYMNSPADIVYYYKFPSGSRNKIKNPAAEKESDRFSKSTVTRAEYTLDGWYQYKNETDGYVTYSGKWDFDSDRVDRDGVTLYAKWNPVIHYTYQLYRYDFDDPTKLVPLGNAYEVNAGDKFRDYLAYSSSVSGYTFAGFFDEEGNPWDNDFTHPGGATHTEIKIIVKFERGVFVDVSTKDELLSLVRQINGGSKLDINLTADIDLEGEAFDGFRNFTRMLYGNNHTIKNFKLNYPNSRDNLSSDAVFDVEGTLPISLFGSMSDAIVKDVNFEGMVIAVNNTLYQTRGIVIAPIAVKAEKSSLTNVTVKAKYIIEALPSGFNRENLVVVTSNDGCFYKDGASVFDKVLSAIDEQIIQ
ncbi:MAG: hypothetical protein J1F39_05260 [Clostridiales bacterium]|nr:hypothetical protein [Clostridiales bacterium]